MKNTTLLLIITSIVFINTASAERKWVKSTNGCTILWDSSEVFRAVEWSGQCKNGYASGHGVAKYHMMDKTQDIFYGNMKKGELDGYGRYQWANGDRYMGFLKKGKMHGKGKIIWNTPNQNIFKSFTGIFYQSTLKKGVYTTINGTKVAKKGSSFNDAINRYNELMSGYLINRHLYYGD